MGQVVIVGCGDIGRRIASLALAAERAVTALVRSAERAEVLREARITPVTGDLNDPASVPPLPTGDALIYYLVPPPGGGITDPRARNFCLALMSSPRPRKLVCISTTAVYGEAGETVVSEETPPNPLTSRGKRRLDAEHAFLEWGAEHGVPVVILRVAGIYGPGRIPLEKIRRGHPLLDERQAPCTNLIHAEDLASICWASGEKGEAGEIFNVSDGHPRSMTSYFNAVTDLLGLPRLPQVGLEEARRIMEPLMFSYMTEGKRIDNGRVLGKLGVRLRYPTLEEGLADAFQAGAELALR